MKEKLQPYFEGQKMIVLATLDENNFPYVSNVYFGYDEDYSLYFLSKLNREHSKHILANRKVAVSIIDTHKYNITDVDKKALQIQGDAKLLEGEDAQKGFEHFKKNIPNVVELGEDHHLWEVMKDGGHNIFKITIKNVKIWDEEKYEYGGEIINF